MVVLALVLSIFGVCVVILGEVAGELKGGKLSSSLSSSSSGDFLGRLICIDGLSIRAADRRRDRRFVPI